MSGGESCGGCQLQELDYKEQLKFKEKKVYNHLKRIGGMENLFLPEEAEQAAGVPDAVVMEPIIGMEDPWRYRNKAQYPIAAEKTENRRRDSLPDGPTPWSRYRSWTACLDVRKIKIIWRQC